MRIFFSHPTFTFHSKTEKKCIDIINEHLETEKIINPADFGLKADLRSKLKSSDSIVAMAVSNCFTYLVWKEIELMEEKEEEMEEKEKKVKIYTFMVENKNDIGPLVEGIPDEIKKLSKKESKTLAHKLTKKDYQDGFLSSLVGSHRSRF
ncbi:MAG: hypothetical protein KGY76_00480 [Candidatus Thermoplasmatota archaeon]|nr:hypothetical protein [Candidatus Thermoplasmatota archaeon]